jgi:hypothetical protein
VPTCTESNIPNKSSQAKAKTTPLRRPQGLQNGFENQKSSSHAHPSAVGVPAGVLWSAAAVNGGVGLPGDACNSRCTVVSVCLGCVCVCLCVSDVCVCVCVGGWVLQKSPRAPKTPHAGFLRGRSFDCGATGVSKESCYKRGVVALATKHNTHLPCQPLAQRRQPTTASHKLWPRRATGLLRRACKDSQQTTGCVSHGVKCLSIVRSTKVSAAVRQPGKARPPSITRANVGTPKCLLTESRHPPCVSTQECVGTG